MNFNRRLELAQISVGDDEGLWGGTGSILDKLDAAIVAVGHSYRKDAYHHDTHNPATIGLVGRVLFAAVGRAFVRSQSPWIGVGYPPDRRAMLERLGVAGDGMLMRRDTAQQALAILMEGLEFGLGPLRAALADDLEIRTERAEGYVEYLPLATHELEEALMQWQIWTRHAADDEILELRRAMDPVGRARRDGLERIPDQYVIEANEAAKALRVRMREFELAERPTVSLKAIEEAREAARQLIEESDLIRLLVCYHDTDRRLRILEEGLDEAVEEYDRHVEQQIDIARGK